MSKKKKLVFRATCRYCKFYQSLHICALSRKKVNGSRPICNDFEIADTFWCDRHNYQIDTVACLNRQVHGYSGCVHCRQGKGIRSISHQLQLSLFETKCLPEREKHENQVGL